MKKAATTAKAAGGLQKQWHGAKWDFWGKMSDLGEKGAKVREYSAFGSFLALIASAC